MSRNTRIKITIPVTDRLVLEVGAQPAFKDRDKIWKGVNTRSRIYVSTSEGVQALLGLFNDSRPEYSQKGDPNQGEWDAWNKRELALEEAMIWQFLRATCITFAPNITLRDQANGGARLLLKAVKWSRKAGCSCGCSPGWVVAADESTSLAEAFWGAYGAGVKDDFYKTYEYWVEARFADEPSREERERLRLEKKRAAVVGSN